MRSIGEVVQSQRRPQLGLCGVLNVKTLVGAFSQEKALVGAFSVIVKTGCGTDGALHSTSYNLIGAGSALH